MKRTSNDNKNLAKVFLTSLNSNPALVSRTPRLENAVSPSKVSYFDSSRIESTMESRICFLSLQKTVPSTKVTEPVLLHLEDDIEEILEEESEPVMDIAVLNRQLAEARRQAEEYRKQLQKKEEEAEIYKQQLRNITALKSIK